MSDRIGTVYFRQWDQNFYFKHNGKAIKLCSGVDGEEQAQQKREEYLESAKYTSATTNHKLDDERCEKILNAYLEHGTAHLDGKSITNKRRVVNAFSKVFGNTPYGQLNAPTVKEWIESVPGWGLGGRRYAAQTLKAAFGYWWLKDRLTDHKLAKLRLPDCKPRGEQFAVSRNIYDTLKCVAPSWLEDIVDFLWLTGCRPSECLSATVEEYRPHLSMLDKASHKNVKKGLARHIKLGPQAKELVERLVAKHKTGRLFRGRDGGVVHVQYVRDVLHALCDQIGLTREQKRFVVPYSFRHAFAVRALTEGKLSVRQVAALMGHNSVKTLEEHYAHTLAALHGIEHQLASVE